MTQPDFADLWGSMVVTDPDRFSHVVPRIQAAIGRYARVSDATGVPWQVIAVLHEREASGNFQCHLHNGDPLTARTVHVPKGYPLHGEPPFSWEESAQDALALDGLSGRSDWSLPVTLDRIERYNGLGYRKRNLLSPYLWAGTNHECPGKFVKDGAFELIARDMQPGCAPLLKLLGYS